jgi:carbon monoxide dehydrogenase subunit G
MQRYSFVTTWKFRAPRETVWDAIEAYPHWPRWWPAIAVAHQISPGAADGLGEVAEVVFRTKLGYRIRFRTRTTHRQAPAELEVRTEGELEGTGRWRLTSEGDTTVVRYVWDVQTRPLWMNLLAPLLRPAFKWNHDQVMQSGQVGLARMLAARRP